jgi:hypothetical protein
MHSRQLLDERFRPRKEGAEHESKEISFIPRCWEMSPCPEAKRAKCPYYMDQIPCWKRRLGCLCDHRLAGYLYHDKAASTANQSQRIDLTAPANPEQYPAQMRSEPRRSWTSRRPFCHNCAIFLEHQGVKYRRLNWVFFPVSLILVLVLFPFYHLAYGLGADKLDALSRHLVAIGKMPTDVVNAGMLLNSPYEYVLLAVLSLLLMSYVVEFTDTCLLEWKL